MDDFPLNKIGLALTPAIVFLAATVFSIYSKKLLSQKVSGWRATEFLTFGILTGTIFPAMTNLPYWNFHFLMVYLGNDALADLTWRYGPLANLLTRHIPYAISLTSHLIAAHMALIAHVRRPWFYVLLAASLAAASYIALDFVRV